MKILRPAKIGHQSRIKATDKYQKCVPECYLIFLSLTGNYGIENNWRHAQIMHIFMYT